MKKERLTSQKKLILTYLKETKSHPTAEEVYKNIRKKLPSLSLSTVYRILNQLKEKGEIQEISLPVSRFDGQMINHAHFICQKCQKIFDLFENYCLKIKKPKIGKINYYQIYFYGLCKKCQK